MTCFCVWANPRSVPMPDIHPQGHILQLSLSLKNTTLANISLLHFTKIFSPSINCFHKDTCCPSANCSWCSDVSYIHQMCSDFIILHWLILCSHRTWKWQQGWQRVFVNVAPPAFLMCPYIIVLLSRDHDISGKAFTLMRASSPPFQMTSALLVISLPCWRSFTNTSICV